MGGKPLLNRSAWKKLNNSLLLRLGGMIAAITLMAIVGMSASWMVAETTQGNGEAINVAGSLRMQSWRMASMYQQLLQDDTPSHRENLRKAIGRFEGDLLAPSIRSMLPGDPAAPLNQAYQQVEAGWRDDIKPTLFPINHDGLSLLDKTPIFVDHINALVKQIEEATEAKIFVLRVILGVAVIGTVLAVILSIYLVNSILVHPLRNLLSQTDQMGKGDLSVRTGLTGEDEIGQLGQAFDRMAEDLSKLYHGLEARVEQKTAELTRSNRSLELLYRSISHLHGTSMSGGEAFQSVLTDTEAVLGLGHGLVCLKSAQDIAGKVIAATQIGEPSLCKQMNNCTECHDTGTARIATLKNGQQSLRLPLADAKMPYGILAVDIPEGVQVEDWQMQLLEALSRHIGVSIASERRIEQNRRVALLEERAVIARELHDSLAQSLAYMKIQVSRLRSAMGKQSEEDMATVLEEMREGLNSAYQQLRELLSTFRLRMETADLGMALAQTTNEFAERGNLKIGLNVNLGDISLSPNEEIHLLHVAREALSNVLKHSGATEAWLRLLASPGGNVSMQVEDNGAGIHKPASLHHYGMTIMEERTRALHGTITYLPRDGGGTCVQIGFQPSSQRPTTPHS